MGKEDGSGFFPVLGFILTDPEDLWRRVAGEHGIAGEFDHLGLPSESLGQFRTFDGGGGVTPELGGADDLILHIKEDQSVLLAADADTGDFRAAGSKLLEDLGDRGLDGGDPGGRILLHGSFTMCLHKAVGLLGAGHDLSGGRVEGDGLGALGAAVDSEGDHLGKYEG